MSNEYIAICTGIQRDGGAIAATVNRAKPSGEELDEIFRGHIAEDTLVLTDGLRSYNVLETLASCTVVDVKKEESRGIFNLNTVNSLHSFIKETYNHYRGVATKYINRYNALFSNAFRCADNLKDMLFSSLCTVGQNCYWHSINDVRNYKLVML
ncbi:MAG: transposase [Lachnospiraceae bacterium]|nr:transposase [Lachnospiraceae bacterium]